MVRNMRVERDASLSASSLSQPSRRGVILVSSGAVQPKNNLHLDKHDHNEEEDNDLLILLNDSVARFAWAFHGVDLAVCQNIFVNYLPH